uniref:K Homology domain-containing protein n=1 Tax=Alexandrium catenella TaxID=2925 RepID=A0A7S1L6X3_ALECA|mmetsp:Transcript_107618/g.286414  ORF Transcript_107618/g.286414 Transcript_107618/m.286414 type:complete len:459 (+) Transcript_107618:95-1471(+)
MRSGLYVEIQKTPESTTWYNGYVVDIEGENIRVEFEDDVWPADDYPTTSVRRCPSVRSGESWTPKVDEPLEVLVPATESSPSGWALAQLKKIKQKSFFFVALEGLLKGPQDMIVEREGVRRVSTEPTIAASGLVRKLVAVDRELHSWLRSQDSIGCLNDVQIKGKLLLASCTHYRPNAKGSPKVTLVGDEHSVALGEKLLVDIHFKHQITMQRFHTHRDRLMEYLSQKENHYKGQFKETFTVDASFVGRIIGKKGENIKRIREVHEVNVLIQDPQEDERWNVTTITVSGEQEEPVQKAKEEMEYIVVKVPIDPQQVGWIVGKGYQNLTDIATKTGLCSSRFDDQSSSIELCGLRHQVEDAKMMISVHRDYLLVYQDMSEERRNIEKGFEELDELKGGKGKKGGKGGRKGAARGRGSGASAGAGKGSQAIADDVQDDYWGRGAASSRRPNTGRGKGRGK